MDYKSNFKKDGAAVLVSTGVTVNVRGEYAMNLAAQLAVHGRKPDGNKKDESGAPIMVPLTPGEAAQRAMDVTANIFTLLEGSGDIQQLPNPF